MNNLPVAAPLDTDFAGRGAQLAVTSVMRVINPQTGMGGTGFLHSSGRVLTAEHVVKGANPSDILLVTTQGAQIRSRSISIDARIDLAAVEPDSPLLGIPPLPLKAPSAVAMGTMLSTWGYPSGYSGLRPLLTIGYLAGTEMIRGGVQRYVVNAAFNSGNSGGPLLHLETGEVIGMVASKLAPLPPHIETILSLLAQQKYGLTWNITAPDGTTQTFGEGKVIGDVLQFLRSQTQLVVGHAVILDDLRSFLMGLRLSP